MNKIFRDLKCRISRFCKCENGAVAMLYGPTVIVLLVAAGLAIDYSRSYLVKKEIARALDAAVLAAGSLAVTNEDAMRTLAEQYFDANISPDTKAKYNPQIIVVVGDDDLTVTSSANVPTLLMKIVGFDNVIVNAKSVAGRTLVNIEVALVLDNTGSMSGSKMSSLKTAAKSLVDTLYATEGSEEYVKFALIPFTGAVNIGTENKNIWWVDADGDSTAAQEDYGSSDVYWWKTSLNGNTAYEMLDAYNVSWKGCVRARVGTGENSEGDTVALDLWDIPPDASDANTLWAPFLKPVYDAVKRSSYPNNITKKVKKKIKKKVKEVLRYDDTCPVSPIVPLDNDQDAVKAGVDSMVASGWTSVPIGLIWGWRVLSSDAPYTEGASSSDTNTKKVIVVLTDGQNNHSYDYNGVYSAYGMPAYGHLGTGWLGNQLDDKLASICSNAKSDDILIYSITFELNDVNTQNLMRNCATRADMYFNSPNGSSLQDAFDQIASGLQKLQLRQ